MGQIVDKLLGNDEGGGDAAVKRQESQHSLY